MDIWSLDKLALFIAFVIPGFITMKVYGLLAATGHRDSSQQLIDAVAYSCLNYAVLAFPILALESSNAKGSRALLVFRGMGGVLAGGTSRAGLRVLETPSNRFLPKDIAAPGRETMGLLLLAAKAALGRGHAERWAKSWRPLWIEVVCIQPPLFSRALSGGRLAGQRGRWIGAHPDCHGRHSDCWI